MGTMIRYIIMRLSTVVIGDNGIAILAMEREIKIAEEAEAAAVSIYNLHHPVDLNYWVVG